MAFGHRGTKNQTVPVPEIGEFGGRRRTEELDNWYSKGLIDVSQNEKRHAFGNINFIWR